MVSYPEAVKLTVETADSKEIVDYIYQSMKKHLEQKAKDAPSYSERAAYLGVLRELYPDYGLPENLLY